MAPNVLEVFRVSVCRRKFVWVVAAGERVLACKTKKALRRFLDALGVRDYTEPDPVALDDFLRGAELHPVLSQVKDWKPILGC